LPKPWNNMQKKKKKRKMMMIKWIQNKINLF
jgi:hypothetical protein